LFVAVPAASAAGGAPFCAVSNQNSNTVSLLDAAPTPPAVTKTVPVGAVPERLAVTPDGRTAVVANAGDGTVSFLDTAAGTVVGAPVTVGSNPFGVAVTPDGRLAYVTNIVSDTVSAIDVSTLDCARLVGRNRSFTSGKPQCRTSPAAVRWQAFSLAAGAPDRP
jgi:YVTN family beta-propeller protein